MRFAEDIDSIAAALSIHVDDLLNASRQTFLDFLRRLLEKKFGKVKRQTLPFTHNGAQYSRLANGSAILQQIAHLEDIKYCEVPNLPDDHLVSPQHAH